MRTEIFAERIHIYKHHIGEHAMRLTTNVGNKLDWRFKKRLNTLAGLFDLFGHRVERMDVDSRDEQVMIEFKKNVSNLCLTYECIDIYVQKLSERMHDNDS